MSQPFQQVGTVALAQIGQSARDRAEQILHQVDRPALYFRVCFAQELFQGKSNHFRPPAPSLPRNPVELCSEIGGHS
jgi:hypothetical protein